MYLCIYIYSRPEQLLILRTYLTRKLSSKGPEVLEKSWSRTFRSNWSQLFWPLNNSKRQVKIICLLSSLYIQPRTLYQKRNNTKNASMDTIVLLTCHLWNTDQSILSPSGWNEKPPSPTGHVTKALAGKENIKLFKWNPWQSAPLLADDKASFREHEGNAPPGTWTSSSSFLPSRRWTWNWRPSVICREKENILKHDSSQQCCQAPPMWKLRVVPLQIWPGGTVAAAIRFWWTLTHPDVTSAFVQNE